MAVNQTTSSGNNGFLYFAVGAIIVALAVLAYFYFNGQPASNTSGTEAAIERSADAIGDAADKIGDSAAEAARSVPQPAPAPAPTQPSPATQPPG